MRGYPRGLARGYFIPVASPDQGEPSCPPLEPPEQEPSRPCTLDRDNEHTRPPRLFVIPPREISFSLGNP